jgi:hypothetical protein
MSSRNEKGQFVPSIRGEATKVPTGSKSRNVRSVATASDLANDGAGFYFGLSPGSHQVYNQVEVRRGFPLEVIIQVEERDKLKVWCIYVPDLGASFCLNYWDEEGKIYGIPHRL